MRRTVTTIQPREAFKNKVSVIEDSLEQARNKQSKKDEISDFKKKPSNFEDDSGELPTSLRT